MKLSKWFEKLFTPSQEESIHSVINGRDLVYIEPISKLRYTPKDYEYHFILYFNSGLTLKYSSNLYESLEELRELFINNIGFSYIKLSYVDMASINVISNKLE